MTMKLEDLVSSSTLLAGHESTKVDNSALAWCKTCHEYHSIAKNKDGCVQSNTIRRYIQIREDSTNPTHTFCCDACGRTLFEAKVSGQCTITIHCRRCRVINEFNLTSVKMVYG